MVSVSLYFYFFIYFAYTAVSDETRVASAARIDVKNLVLSSSCLPLDLVSGRAPKLLADA